MWTWDTLWSLSMFTVESGISCDRIALIINMNLLLSVIVQIKAHSYFLKHGTSESVFIISVHYFA